MICPNHFETAPLFFVQRSCFECFVGFSPNKVSDNSFFTVNMYITRANQFPLSAFGIVQERYRTPA